MLNPLLGKKILITGATGFIGSNLVRMCMDAQADVHVFIRKTADIWRIKSCVGKITVHDIDLLDFDSIDSNIKLIKPEVIFHTATWGGRPYQNDPKAIFETNFSATVNLLNACNSVGFEIFINTGSSSEYGIKKIPMKETDLLEPLSDYGVSKAAAALYCQALAKRENKTIVTLRLFSPYGYYEDKNRLIPALILSCLNDVDPELASPSNVRDFVFVEDVLSAYRLAVANKDKVAGKIINIGSGRQADVKEVVNVISRISERNIRALWNKKENPRVEPDFWQADISLAKELLSWKPEYDLYSGLEKSLEWFNTNKKMY